MSKVMKANKNKIILAILAIYGIVLLYVLFFRRIGVDYPWTYPEYLNAMHNFIPFKSVYDLFTAPVLPVSVVFRFALNFFGNILLFIPWGVLLPACFERMRFFRRFAILTLVTLIAVETIQILTMLGSFDVEDIMLNMAGACIGYAIWTSRKKL